MIHYYEKKFGPFQWQRVGYVGVPFNAGAMEHATNIAYPLAGFDGTLAYESLAFHEIAHAWFGNLLTCAAAHEMWINEGLGTYAETIAQELLDPTGEAFKEAMRDIHRNVITRAHVNDGDYYAVNQVPAEATYGTTSYEKGALVSHTLRGYLGDSLFFQGLTTLLQERAFSHITSAEFCEALSEITNVDLTHYYNDWVNQPGFLHFYVDSVIHHSGNQYEVHLRQRMFEANHLGTAVPVEVAFISSDGTQEVRKIVVNGETTIATVTLPFAPVHTIVDPNERMGDAIVDYNITSENTDVVECNDAYFEIKPLEIAAPSSWRVEHHYAAPDPLKEENEGIFAISPTHFWRVLNFDDNVSRGYLFFDYKASNAQQLDYALFNGYSTNQFILLYRKNNQHDWITVPGTVLGSASMGAIATLHIAAGEYTLAVGNPVSIQEHEYAEQFTIYPNPAQHTITIDNHKENTSADVIEVYNMAGVQITETQIDSLPYQLSIDHLPTGKYIIRLKEKKEIIFVGSFEKIKP